MKFVQHETKVVNASEKPCKDKKDHIYLSNGFGKISLRKLSHTQEKVCFLCGQHEVAITKIVTENPFSFAAVVKRHHGAE